MKFTETSKNCVVKWQNALRAFFLSSVIMGSCTDFRDSNYNNLDMKIDLNHRRTKFPTILIKSEIKNTFFSSHCHAFWSFWIIFEYFWIFLIVFDRFWSILIDFDWFWLILIDFDRFWSILIVLCTLNINKMCFGSVKDPLITSLLLVIILFFTSCKNLNIIKIHQKNIFYKFLVRFIDKNNSKNQNK